MPEIKDLTFSRLYTFTHIPRYLFEQVKELDAEMIERIYQFGHLFAASPTTFLYVLIDDVNVIHGVLWATVDIIEAIIFVKLFSVDSEYQTNRGELLKTGVDFLMDQVTGGAIKKEIRFVTTKPKAYEKIGAVRSKQILMEIKNELTNNKPDSRTDDKDNPKRGNTTDTDEPTE